MNGVKKRGEEKMKGEKKRLILCEEENKTYIIKPRYIKNYGVVITWKSSNNERW